MNRFNFTLIIAAFCYTHTLKSQNIHGITGADAQMQGRISSTLSNAFSVINNPSQMSWLKTWQGGVYTEQRFTKSELMLSNISVSVPSKLLDIGAAISYYGFNDFNQQRFTFSASRKLAQTFSLGVQLNYVLTNISEYGTATALVFGAGVTYRPADRIMIGFSVYNPDQRELSNKVSDKIPSYARFGIRYKVSDKVDALAEADQLTERNTSFRGAVRYQPGKTIGFALGISTQPVVFNFGTTVTASNMNIDMAAGVHQVLGVIPQVSLRFPASYASARK